MVSAITSNMAVTLTIIETIAVALFVWKVSSNYNRAVNAVSNCQGTLMREILHLEKSLETKMDISMGKFRHIDRYLSKTQEDYISSDFE